MNWSAFLARFDPARAAQMDLWVLGDFKLPEIHAALVIVHVLAALRHHLLEYDYLMRRM